jgi:hypothetical protein
MLTSASGDCQSPNFLVEIRAHVVSGPAVAIFGPVECHVGPTPGGIVRPSELTFMLVQSIQLGHRGHPRKRVPSTGITGRRERWSATDQEST